MVLFTEVGSPMNPVKPLLFLLGVSVAATPPAAAKPFQPILLNYEGSLNLPRPSVGEYYALTITHVPDGNTRPAWPGAPVTGPSVIIYYSWQGHTFEFNRFPTLSKTPGGLGTAVELARTNGGTYFVGSAGTRSVDSAGNIWDFSGPSSSSGDCQMYSDPGEHVLGVTNLSAGYGVQETGWPGCFRLNGFLRRGDGTGGNYPSDGTAVGARFVVAQRGTGPSTNVPVVVYQSTRTSASAVSSAELFRFNTGGAFDGSTQFHLQYVRSTDFKEYFVRWLCSAGHGGDSYKLDLYAGTASGTDPKPLVSPDIGRDIGLGAGWLDPSSTIRNIGVDWAKSRLYVLESFGQDARVHVFTVTRSPPPGTVIFLK